jgi:hypothetical protein
LAEFLAERATLELTLRDFGASGVLEMMNFPVLVR